jgi:hypothetical protein
VNVKLSLKIVYVLCEFKFLLWVYDAGDWRFWLAGNIIFGTNVLCEKTGYESLKPLCFLRLKQRIKKPSVGLRHLFLPPPSVPAVQNNAGTGLQQFLFSFQGLDVFAVS